jgi:hypothetical protein
MWREREKEIEIERERKKKEREREKWRGVGALPGRSISGLSSVLLSEDLKLKREKRKHAAAVSSAQCPSVFHTTAAVNFRIKMTNDLSLSLSFSRTQRPWARLRCCCP